MEFKQFNNVGVVYFAVQYFDFVVDPGEIIFELYFIFL